MGQEACDLASAKTIAIAHVSTITSANADARVCEGVFVGHVQPYPKNQKTRIDQIIVNEGFLAICEPPIPVSLDIRGKTLSFCIRVTYCLRNECMHACSQHR